MTHEEHAVAFFVEGYNCAQSVILAFADEIGLPQETALLVASSFGGGMGRLREVCGAVSGMFMAAGMLYGYTDPRDHHTKGELYARIQELAATFREENGSIVCRELLGLKQKIDTPAPSPRTAEYYAKRPCARLVGSAARILEAYIAEHPPKA